MSYRVQEEALEAYQQFASDPDAEYDAVIDLDVSWPGAQVTFGFQARPGQTGPKIWPW